MRPRRQRDQHIEVQIAQFFRCEPSIIPDSCQNLARFNPIILGRGENWMAALEGTDKMPLGGLIGPTPELG